MIILKKLNDIISVGVAYTEYKYIRNIILMSDKLTIT